MPANKALGAQEEAKKDLVDKVNFWMHCNLHHILSSVVDIYHKALTAPTTDKESAASARKLHNAHGCTPILSTALS